MSKNSKRAGARGERWFHPDRVGLVRAAFEEGVRGLDRASFRSAIVAGSQPYWAGMAALKKHEKERVYRDVRAFATANVTATEVEAVKTAVLSPPKGFVARLKGIFGA
jgi:hypothetical protein